MTLFGESNLHFRTKKGEIYLILCQWVGSDYKGTVFFIPKGKLYIIYVYICI